MTDPSLDRRVAEIVGTLQEDGRHPHYSTYLIDAIAALEAMRVNGWSWEIDSYSGEPYQCDLYPPNGSWVSGGKGETLPLAICKAIVATQEGK